jgi:hypothetical protein
MNLGKVQRTIRDTIEFESIEQLDEILDQLSEKSKEKPCLVDVIIPSGDSLAIGLGAEDSLLSFVSSSGDPPYFISKGESNDTENTVVFYWNEEWSEFPKSSLISIESARCAIREFVRTGKLSDEIIWEE